MSLTKFLALLFTTALLVGNGVLVMVYGWGLKPQSWWWIVGGGVVAQTALRVIATKIEKDEGE